MALTPYCQYCGCLHIGTQPGKCVYQCERCNLDTRDDAEGFGHQKCKCPPLPPIVWTRSPAYEIMIEGLKPIRLTQSQWDDMRAAMSEHDRNGFRDGWCRMGTVRIVEIASYSAHS